MKKRFGACSITTSWLKPDAVMRIRSPSCADRQTGAIRNGCVMPGAVIRKGIIGVPSYAEGASSEDAIMAGTTTTRSYPAIPA